MHFPIKVLFLCTGNSARSQMAEGLLRYLGKAHFEVSSAGTQPKELNPLAVAVMQELRIDISGQRSKDLSEFLGSEFDYIITVCDRARDDCPTFPGDNQRIHWSFEDPAAAVGDERHKLEVFRRIRNEIRTRITIWLPAMMKLLKDKGITT